MLLLDSRADGIDHPTRSPAAAADVDACGVGSRVDLDVADAAAAAALVVCSMSIVLDDSSTAMRSLFAGSMDSLRCPIVAYSAAGLALHSCTLQCLIYFAINNIIYFFKKIDQPNQIHNM